jgi:hypothetical protein
MIYMDLGMSSMQVDAWERGFSYAYDAPLDMRMDTRQQFDAADLVNEWPEARIAQVLRRFGEERYAGGIAREIVRRRPLKTTSELVEAIKAGMPTAARFGGGHPAKRASSDPDRRQRRARGVGPRRCPRLSQPSAAARGDLLPLARGPAGEAVPSPPRPGLHPPELRLASAANGEAEF